MLRSRPAGKEKPEGPAAREFSLKKFIAVIGLVIGAYGHLYSRSALVPSAANAPEPSREQRIRWWREAKFGLFITWGLYAVPAGAWKDHIHPEDYSEWIMFDEKIPVMEYARLAGQFDPVKFEAEAWAAIASNSGMKYVVLTAKHHDGFSMFKTALTDFNIVDATPFKRDVTGELAQACREAGLKFGCYYSDDRDWHRPQGPGNRYKQTNTWDFPASKAEDFDAYFSGFAKPQVVELLTQYRPDILWFDGIGMKSDAQFEDLFRTIRKLRPDCLINSRIKTVLPVLPDPFCYCDYLSFGDNEILKTAPGTDWENPGTMNTSYGYSWNDNAWISAREIVVRLIDIVSKGGNYLLNVGPTAEGLIPKPSIDRLVEVGTWLRTNGEAIYGTSPWRVYGEGPSFDREVAGAARGESKAPLGAGPDAGAAQVSFDIRFTAKPKTVYVLCLTWPEQSILIRTLGRKAMPGEDIAAARLLGSKEDFHWRQTNGGLVLSVPKEKPCRHALVYRIDLR